MNTAKDIFMTVKFDEMWIHCTAINCRRCANKTNCDMHAIAADMIMRGDY